MGFICGTILVECITVHYYFVADVGRKRMWEEIRTWIMRRSSQVTSHLQYDFG